MGSKKTQTLQVVNYFQKENGRLQNACRFFYGSKFAALLNKTRFTINQDLSKGTGFILSCEEYA
jgi:hypothetical protein